MKNIIILHFLIVSCLFSCKKNEKNDSQNINPQEKKDTIVNSSAIFLLTPDDIEIKELKEKHGEDNFYTIADDANYYVSQIRDISPQKLNKIRYKNINFSREDYIFKKNAYSDKWLIINYTEGSKPKVYSLVDYYMSLNGEGKENSDFSYYEKNDDYFTRDIDINKDGFKDKVVSSKKNMGDDLIFFLGNEKSKYQFALKTYNFSEDGGFVIDDIKPLTNNSTNEVFYITTYFDGSGGAQRINYIAYEGNKWKLTRSVYITSDWRSDVNKEYYCDIKQNITLDDKKIREKLHPMPDETVRDKVCKSRYKFEDTLGQFEENIKNSVNYTGIERYQELLLKFPINNSNILQYNNIAYYLYEKGAYNESILLIKEILKKDPNRIVAWFNLADLQWELGNKNEAKKSYQQYILLMKSQGKDLKKIPNRVYERSK